MPLADLFARNLRATRARKHLSQQRLADKAGLSVSYISMLERGERLAPLDTIDVLARALGVRALSLLDTAAKR
jgi:transcriptional regulator with XRE-family HTH domain